jgi:predicted phage-related endonuclease
MKITNQVVINSVESLNQLTELKLPVKTAFRLAKITRKMNEVLDTYNEVLRKIQQDHVEKDEDDKPKTLDDPNDPNIKRLVFSDPAAFKAAYQELLEIETEVDFKKLQVEDLGNIEVTPATLFPIEWLIEEE